MQAHSSSRFMPSRSQHAASVEYQTELQRQILPLLERHTRLRYMSLFPLFCKSGMKLDSNWTDVPKGQCSHHIPGTSIEGFSNENHLATVGAIYMWPYICEQIQAGMPREDFPDSSSLFHSSHSSSRR